MATGDRALKRAPDGTVLPDQDFGTVFDDVLDELHSKSRGPSKPDTLTLDQIERREQEFFRGIAQELNSRLIATGTTVVRIYLDATDGETYRVVLKDRDGRPFNLQVSVDRLMEMNQQFGENVGRELINTLTQEAQEARDLWFARMQ